MNALWALKNLLLKAPTEDKRRVVARLGWFALVECLSDVDADAEVQEQGLYTLCHLADREEGAELAMQLVEAEVLLDAQSRASDANKADMQCQIRTISCINLDRTQTIMLRGHYAFSHTSPTACTHTEPFCFNTLASYAFSAAPPLVLSSSLLRSCCQSAAAR